MIFGTNLSTLNIGLMICGRARWQEAEATRKDFNIVLTRQDKKFFISELFNYSGRNPIDPSLQDNVLIPDNFFDYIYHIGCVISLFTLHHKIRIESGRTKFKQGKTDGILYGFETHE